MSMRSSNGPEIFDTYRCICIGERLHSRVGSLKNPQGHGFIALLPRRLKRAENQRIGLISQGLATIVDHFKSTGVSLLNLNLLSIIRPATPSGAKLKSQE